jgi:hypothetical protein
VKLSAGHAPVVPPLVLVPALLLVVPPEPPTIAPLPPWLVPSSVDLLEQAVADASAKTNDKPTMVRNIGAPYFLRTG